MSETTIDEIIERARRKIPRSIVIDNDFVRAIVRETAMECSRIADHGGLTGVAKEIRLRFGVEGETKDGR